MPLIAPRKLALFSILVMSGTAAFDKLAAQDGYRHIGTALFRRSYAGHENWTKSQLDSVERMDPEYLMSEASGDSALRILNTMGIAADEHLLPGENGSGLRDTIMIVDRGSETSTAYIEKDTIDWQMALCIKSRRTTSRIPIAHVSSSFVAYFLPSRTGGQPFIAVLQYYYIMNGDNYQVDVYGQGDLRDGQK